MPRSKNPVAVSCARSWIGPEPAVEDTAAVRQNNETNTREQMAYLDTTLSTLLGGHPSLGLAQLEVTPLLDVLWLARTSPHCHPDSVLVHSHLVER